MINDEHLLSFETYLRRNDYSSLVIKQYVQSVKKFLDLEPSVVVQRTNQKRLKEIISTYILVQPLTSQKGLIQSSLHAYYQFVTGEKIYKRLSISDYKINSTIDSEIERFRKYLIDIAGLSNNIVISHCNTVKIFVYSIFLETNFLSGKITIEHIKTYLTNTINHLSNASKKTIITRIRNYMDISVLKSHFVGHN